MLIENPLRELRERLALMASKSLAVFERAVKLLESRSAEELEEVRKMDREVDQLEMQIDRLCMSLLLKEPYALDFRFVYSVAKTIIDLERVGDQGKTIGKWALKLPEPGVSEDMRALAQKAGEALHLAVRALVEQDAAAADQVLLLEFQVDAIEDRIIEESTSVAVAFIAKALERIGDLATNIAEEVIFTVRADDVRHGGFKKES